MTFNFGNSQAPNTSGQQTGSLFGTASGNTTSGSGGNLFGGNTGANTGFSFGAPAQKSAGSGGEQRPLFGATADNKPAASLFGAPSSGAAPPSTGGGFSFGQSATSGQPSLFGTPKPATSTPSQPAATPAPNASKPAFSFGNPSTTPAGPPPAGPGPGFGASTGTSNAGGGGLFANLGGSKPADSGSSTPSFSFGKPAESSNTPSNAPQQAASGGLFGGAKPAAPTPSLGGGFNFGPKTTDKPAENSQPPQAPTAKPAFSFPAPSAAPVSSAPTTSAPLFSAAPATTATSGTPSLFGAAQASSQPSQPAQPATTPSGSAPLFGAPASTAASAAAPKPAFSFGPPSSQPPASTTSATSEAPKPSLFGGLGGSSTPAAPSSGLFAKPAAPTAATTSAAPTTTAPAQSTPFGGLGTSTSGLPGSSAADPKLAASTSGPIPPAQSRLKNKTMDEILTRWATELTKYTKEFKNHAETIAKWDQTIVDNTSKIDKLYIKTRTCERQTMSVEMQLSAIESQQSELEGWLTKYENDVDEMLAKDSSNTAEVGGPDQDRERTYKLAEKLQERLDDMGRDLEGMVEEVNAANASLSKNGKGDEPITQIVRILNTHLSQLQNIDHGTAELQKKVAEAQKAANGLGYLNGANGEAKSAVDDFYRSYMGRR